MSTTGSTMLSECTWYDGTGVRRTEYANESLKFGLGHSSTFNGVVEYILNSTVVHESTKQSRLLPSSMSHEIF